MDTEGLEDLQESLLTIISSLIMEDDKDEISRMQDQALKIISNEGYRKHINDDTKYKCTILDAIKKCSISVGQSDIEKHGLAEIEQAIKDAGGKTSEELGRNSSLDEINHEDLINALIEAQRNQRNVVIGISKLMAVVSICITICFAFCFKPEGEELYTWTDSLLICSVILVVCAIPICSLLTLNRIDIREELENAGVEQPNVQQR